MKLRCVYYYKAMEDITYEGGKTIRLIVGLIGIAAVLLAVE
jgi:hypothetical protein